MGMSTIVGAAIVASAMPTSGAVSGAIMATNSHDIIVCRAAYRNVESCDTGETPYEYAGKAGYKFVYKRGVLFIEKDKYIVMEVGNQ